MSAKCTLASRVDSFHESSAGKVTVHMEHIHINAEFKMNWVVQQNKPGTKGLNSDIFLTSTFTYMEDQNFYKHFTIQCSRTQHKKLQPQPLLCSLNDTTTLSIFKKMFYKHFNIYFLHAAILKKISS